jgi:hypothetical protein
MPSESLTLVVIIICDILGVHPGDALGESDNDDDNFFLFETLFLMTLEAISFV